MIMNKLSEFLQDEDGSLSATRLAFLTWVFGALTTWVVSSYNHQKMQEIPQSVQVMIGILMTGKAVQKFGEHPEDSAASRKPTRAELPPSVQPVSTQGDAIKPTNSLTQK
jgi:hypothetical protein